MNHSFKFFLVFVVLLGFISFSPAATITGTVTDSNTGLSVSDANITAFSVNQLIPDTLMHDAISDSNGSYSLPNVSPGTYFIWCEHPNYFPASQADVVIDDSTSSVTVDFNMLSDTTTTTGSMSLSGYVYESDSSGVVGSPIHQAIVVIYGLDSFSGGYYTTTTNQDGSYLIENIVSGIYEGVCSFQNYIPNNISGIDLSVGNATQDFHLVADSIGSVPTFLSGFVYQDSLNTPVFPAEISLFGFSPDGDTLTYNEVNNWDGSYFICGLIPGTYTATCTADGYQPQVVNNVVISDSATYLDFYFTSTGSTEDGLITGNVFSDGSGASFQGAIINFISMNGLNYFNSETDINGNYTSPPLPVGDYYVSCYTMSNAISQDSSNFFYMEYYDDAHSLADATILNLTQNDTIQNINFGIPTSATIANVTVNGNVTDNNDVPIENALVTVWSNQNQGVCGDTSYFSAYSDAQGNYTIAMTHNFSMFAFSFIISAESQNYEVEYWQEKATPWEADPIWISGDTTITGIDFTLNTYSVAINSISGTITDNSGSPLSYGLIVGADTINAQFAVTYSDSAGNYTLGSLADGNYYLLFMVDGYVPEFYDDVLLWEDATPVHASGTVTGINASLVPITSNSSNGAIAGTVLDGSNIPLSGVLMTAKNNLGEVIGYDMTNGQGGYKITGIIGGDYNVSASKIYYNSQTEAVNFNSTMNTLLVNFDLNQVVAGISEEKGTLIIPTDLELASNFPNPFNPETKISIGLPNAQHVKVVVYNLLGQNIMELANGELPAGRHTFIWNGTDSAGKNVSSGIYFYSLETADQRLVKKMIFSK